LYVAVSVFCHPAAYRGVVHFGAIGRSLLICSPLSCAPADTAAHLYGFRFGDTSAFCSLSRCPRTFGQSWHRANLQAITNQSPKSETNSKN